MVYLIYVILGELLMISAYTYEFSYRRAGVNQSNKFLVFFMYRAKLLLRRTLHKTGTTVFMLLKASQTTHANVPSHKITKCKEEYQTNKQ